MKVDIGLNCHNNPAIKLEGNAINPIMVWNVPNAVALKCSGDRSDTNALCVPSINAYVIP